MDKRSAAHRAIATLIFSFLLLVVPAASQTARTRIGRYWVVFRDKGSRSVDLRSLSPQSLGISARSMWRRSKVLPSDRLIDSYDLPVSEDYLNALRAAGFTIHATSRWLNAASVEADEARLPALRAIPSVQDIQLVHERRLPLPAGAKYHRHFLAKTQTSQGIDYGPSLQQLADIRISDLHKIGIIGSGIIIGMLDDGFDNHTTHVALKNIHVIAEHDFVQNDNNTSLAPGEYAGQGIHGAGTLSSIAGFDNGTLIGGAFGASMILAKTEIDSVEIHQEEDNYVAGLEWMEQLGADIASSSLGYDIFDDSTRPNIYYPQKDGKTGTTSKAARVAASKGLLLCTAMGNEGWYRTINPDSTGTLITPADADSIVSVGALEVDPSDYSNAAVAGFSSTGPTSDGRIKPEVVAQGVDVWWAYGGSTDEYWYVNGTSCSTPLTASSAALILSAHPELTPMQVRAALMNSAVQINDGTSNSLFYPNNFYGWGMVDAMSAALSQGLIFSNIPIVAVTDSFFLVTTWIRSNVGLNADSIALYFRMPGNPSYQRAALTPGPNAYEYAVQIPRSIIDSTAVGYFAARDQLGSSRRSPYNAPDSLFSLARTPDSILQYYPTGVNQVTPVTPQTYVLMDNYPNPFNPSTTIRFFAPHAEIVELAVFDILGQRIATLYSGRCQPGINSASWNGSPDGSRISSATGVYFYRLKTPSSILTGKMLLIR